MEYAVVEIGGAQFKVKKGDEFRANLASLKPGKALKLDKVLMRCASKKLELGNPYLHGASVTCDVAGEGRGRKLTAYKYKRRKSSKFKKGHRQNFVVLKVKSI